MIRMQHHVEYCLRNLVGKKRFEGKFSEEMERFWHTVDIQYKRCGIVSGVPQNHIPFWYVRAVDQGIPVEWVEKLESIPISPTPAMEDSSKIDGRTKEGRAIRAQMESVGA